MADNKGQTLSTSSVPMMVEWIKENNQISRGLAFYTQNVYICTYKQLIWWVSGHALFIL